MEWESSCAEMPPNAFGLRGSGGGVEGVKPNPPSLPASELWKIEPVCECCDRAYACSRVLDDAPRALESVEAGVEGRNCGGLACDG